MGFKQIYSVVVFLLLFLTKYIDNDDSYQNNQNNVFEEKIFLDVCVQTSKQILIGNGTAITEEKPEIFLLDKDRINQELDAFCSTQTFFKTGTIYWKCRFDFEISTDNLKQLKIIARTTNSNIPSEIISASSYDKVCSNTSNSEKDDEDSSLMISSVAGIQKTSPPPPKSKNKITKEFSHRDNEATSASLSSVTDDVTTSSFNLTDLFPLLLLLPLSLLIVALYEWFRNRSEVTRNRESTPLMHETGNIAETCQQESSIQINNAEKEENDDSISLSNKTLRNAQVLEKGTDSYTEVNGMNNLDKTHELVHSIEATNTQDNTAVNETVQPVQETNTQDDTAVNETVQPIPETNTQDDTAVNETVHPFQETNTFEADVAINPTLLYWGCNS
ncbi:uncharacterized protein LOC129922965 isoform X1 [Biomphalaria glabrata]|uniref:Uncharacterized protein LOC129922965 isoform X1 n=1 Tax=Biomphalaria glabrata TaxID=6526 RepID=A0A9W2YX87_BIOGL|nr:uncharacterized protein LOC129922965 isoform X1 [Biomphalaria glabrata]XP_055867331.1 uncharacterized protein LOC129922965 isoform X1 [Biomphalaria glabrata]